LEFLTERKVEWPKEISKFFSQQRLASISLGFRVIKISSLGVFYKNVGILLGRMSDWGELGGVTHRRWWSCF
jgi:hypothetical protein